MKNESHRGPIVWTALYTVSILATLGVLLLHDHWSDVDVRTWSPIAQSVLTAIAIIAGFYVQAWKREGDRKVASKDAQAVIVAVTDFLEHHTMSLREDARNGTLNARRIQISLPSFEGGLKTLEGVDMSLLPDRLAMTKFLGLLNDLRGLLGVYNDLARTLPRGNFVPTARLDGMYERMFKKRTALLIMFGVEVESWRVQP